MQSSSSSSEAISKSAIITALACYVSWGIFPIYWKALTHISAVETLMHRIIWSFAFYVLFLLGRFFIQRRMNWMSVSAREWKICIVCSLLMAINWGVFIYAVNIGQVVEASLAYFINPLMSVAVGVIIFREPFPRLLKFAFIMALIGVVIRIGYGSQFPWIAMVLAVSFCIYGALKKVVKTEALQFSLMESAVILLPALIGATMIRHDASLPLVMTDWWLLAGGGFITGVPLLLFARAAQQLPYSIMGMFQFIGPTLQFLVAISWYGETLAFYGWVSFAFIWGGVGFYVLDRIRVAAKLRRKSRVPLAVPEEPL